MDAWQPTFACLGGGLHKDTLEPLADAAFGHHGKPPHDITDSNLRLPSPTVAAIRQCISEAVRLLLPGCVTLPGDGNARQALRPVSWLFAGLLVAADWLASGQGFAYCETCIELAAYWTGCALPQARAAVTACGIQSPLPRLGGGFHDFLPHIHKKYVPMP